VGGFAGVPVFQAEGLTVKTERARYTPLFLAREDLDAAVGNAYNQRGGEREAGASAGVAAAAQEDQRAQQAVTAPARGVRGAFGHLIHVRTVWVVPGNASGWLRPSPEGIRLCTMGAALMEGVTAVRSWETCGGIIAVMCMACAIPGV
jgi:hypothetical protein